jgi:single-strand DNA-binding protein
MYLNKVMIIGNLTRDPELKALPSGSKVVNMGVATNRYYKNKDGGREEQVEYHNIVAFARLAELCAQYLKKGNQVFVEGRLQTRSWESDGAKKYKTEIIADTIQFGNKTNGGTPNPSPSNAKTKSEIPDSGEQIDYPQEEIKAEDIPF